MLKCYRNLLQHATQIELLCGMLHPSTYDDAVCVCVCERARITTSPYVKVRHPVLNLLKAGNRAIVCSVYDATCTTPPTAHRPPLQWPSATARWHSSWRRRCIMQCRLTTATWYAGQLLLAVGLNVALITLLSSHSAWLRLSMSPKAFSATCWQQHPWLELCGISIFWMGNYRDMDMPRLRYSIRYDISCHHYALL